MQKNDNKILLILDLDETLIHATHVEQNMPVDFMLDDYLIYKRPFVDEFFTILQDDFIFAVWSSATNGYVNRIVKQIIPNFISLEFVWSRERCTLRRDFLMEYGYDPDYYEYTKPLSKVKAKGYDLQKILIVDDTPFKCFANYGNAIYPKAFEGDKNDDELLYLAKYLQTLKNKDNVRTIEKRYWRSEVKNL